MTDRIVGVRVTLHAAEGHPVDDRPGGGHAVQHGGDAELLVIGAALVIGLRVPMEGGGDALLQGGLRQQIAGQLVDEEGVVGLVAIVGVDQPVAVSPGRAFGVLFVALGVGVAGEVEPERGPPFTVARRGEQAVHLTLVSIRRGVCGVGGDFGGGGGQASQVERDASQQGGSVRPGGGGELLPLQPRPDEPVDGRTIPGRVSDGGRCLGFGRDKGPVFRPLGAFDDPLP